MKRILYLLLIGVILAACTEASSKRHLDNQQAESEVTYFEDPKTNLCFAQASSQSYLGYNITSITCVPCEAIRELLKKQQK